MSLLANLHVLYIFYPTREELKSGIYITCIGSIIIICIRINATKTSAYIIPCTFKVILHLGRKPRLQIAQDLLIYILPINYTVVRSLEVLYVAYLAL